MPLGNDDGTLVGAERVIGLEDTIDGTDEGAPLGFADRSYVG